MCSCCMMHIIHRDKKALYYFWAHYVADWWLHQRLRLILNSAKKGTGKCFHDKEVNKCLQAVFPPLCWLRSIAHIASGLLQVVTCRGSNVSGAFSAVTENYEHKRTVHSQAFTRLSRFLKNVCFSPTWSKLSNYPHQSSIMQTYRHSSTSLPSMDSRASPACCCSVQVLSERCAPPTATARLPPTSPRVTATQSFTSYWGKHW